MILNCTLAALSVLALEPMMISQCEVHFLIGFVCLIVSIPSVVIFLIIYNSTSEVTPYYGAVDENENLIVEDFIRIIDAYRGV